MQLDARLLCLYFNLWWAYLRDKLTLAVLASCRYDICVANRLDEDSLRPKLQISPSSSRLMYHMHNACN